MEICRQLLWLFWCSSFCQFQWPSSTFSGSRAFRLASSPLSLEIGVNIYGSSFKCAFTMIGYKKRQEENIGFAGQEMHLGWGEVHSSSLCGFGKLTWYHVTHNLLQLCGHELSVFSAEGTPCLANVFSPDRLRWAILYLQHRGMSSDDRVHLHGSVTLTFSMIDSEISDRSREKMKMSTWGT